MLFNEEKTCQYCRPAGPDILGVGRAGSQGLQDNWRLPSEKFGEKIGLSEPWFWRYCLSKQPSWFRAAVFPAYGYNQRYRIIGLGFGKRYDTIRISTFGDRHIRSPLPANRSWSGDRPGEHTV